jgi:hypothetical protein
MIAGVPLALNMNGGYMGNESHSVNEEHWENEEAHHSGFALTGVNELK